MFAGVEFGDDSVIHFYVFDGNGRRAKEFKLYQPMSGPWVLKFLHNGAEVVGTDEEIRKVVVAELPVGLGGDFVWDYHKFLCAYAFYKEGFEDGHVVGETKGHRDARYK